MTSSWNSLLATPAASRLMDSFAATTQETIDEKFLRKKRSRSAVSLGGPSKSVIGEASRKFKMLQIMFIEEGLSMTLCWELPCSPAKASLKSDDML
jgi:hypothetical protein